MRTQVGGRRLFKREVHNWCNQHGRAAIRLLGKSLSQRTSFTGLNDLYTLFLFESTNIIVFLFVKNLLLECPITTKQMRRCRAVEAGAGNLPGEVPEDEDIDGPGHVVWRRNCLISLENKRSG